MEAKDSQSGNISVAFTTTANLSMLEDIEETRYQEAERILLSWIPPILIVFGTVGNSLTVFIMTRRHICSQKTRLLLTCLAIIDTFVLVTGLLRHWMIAIVGYDFRDSDDWSCAMHVFLVSYSIHLSVWVLVAVTLDRYISVCYPMRAKSSCSVSVATGAIILIFITMFFMDSHYLIGERLQDNQCSSKLANNTFYTLIWPWVDLAFNFLIPFIILLTCNVTIMRKLRVRKRFRQRAISGNDVKGVMANNVSTMLLTVNFVFLGTMFPMSLFLLLDGFFLVQGHYPVADDAYGLIYSVCALVAYVNHAVNFYLYCLSSPVFRRELARLSCLGRIKPKKPCITRTTEISSRF